MLLINPFLTNGFSHYYHLGEHTVKFRGVRSEIKYIFHFPMKFLLANRIAPDVTPRSAASHLGLCCLPMSHKKNARLYELSIILFSNKKTLGLASKWVKDLRRILRFSAQSLSVSGIFCVTCIKYLLHSP